MAEDLDRLLGDAAGQPRSAIDGAAVRRRAEHRRRRSAALIAAVVAMIVVVPALGLLVQDDADRVMIDQPTPPAQADTERNDTVYRIEVDLHVRVTGEVAEHVHAVVPTDGRHDHPVTAPLGDVSFVATADREVELELQAQGPEGIATGTVALLDGLDVVIEETATTLEAGVPTPVSVHVVPAGTDADPWVLTEPVSAALPVRAGDGTAGAIEITRTPRAVTGSDLGVPGPVDVPDQRLPRPAVGDGIATQLQDGRPVWVVGLDDGQVSVVDARSTHEVSGLVGWCGTMPGFIDSPGASRFDARGGYTFGPAPYGLPTYDVQVAEDHVVVTRRLPPAPRPDLTGESRPQAPIEGSPLPQGQPCEVNPEGLQEGRIVEDYRGQPGWAQHDLSAWPPFDGQADGWYRADEVTAPESLVPAPRSAVITGDLLVHRVDGETIDAVGPPGSTELHFDNPDRGLPSMTALLLEIAEGPTADCPEEFCRHGSVSTTEVMWVTSDALLEVTNLTPPRGAVLYPSVPQFGEPRPLAEDARIDAEPGDLVEIELDTNGYAAISLTTVE